MLNAKAIREEIEKGNIHVDGGIEKVEDNYIKVTLGNKLKVYDTPVLDVKTPNKSKEIIIPEEGYLLEPGKLYLGRTNEYTKTYGFVPVLSGVSELAALGVEIHITAGFGDNGFEGTWTLEIVCTNLTYLYPNMDIGRIYYYPLVGDPNITYKGKYFKQVEPTESRMSVEYGKKRVLKPGEGDGINVNK